MPGLTVWQWQDAIKPPVRYAIGEAVVRRRPWLGVYDTAEAARAACLAWLAVAEAGQAGPGGDATGGVDLASGGQADGRLGALGAAGGSDAGATMARDSSLWLDATGGGAVEPTTEG